MSQLPYSPARTSGQFVYTAGQVGKDPDTGIVKIGIVEQTRQAMLNLSNALESQGSSLTNTVKTTVFLTNMDDYIEFNEVYEGYFSEPYPARTTVCVKELPRIADTELVVEIEAVATI